MKKECRYILNEEEVTCIGDILKAKDTINRTINSINCLNIAEITDALRSADKRLTTALEKLTFK